VARIEFQRAVKIEPAEVHRGGGKIIITPGRGPSELHPACSKREMSLLAPDVIDLAKMIIANFTFIAGVIGEA
jgi:hypothetical protein